MFLRASLALGAALGLLGGVAAAQVTPTPAETNPPMPLTSPLVTPTTTPEPTHRPAEPEGTHAKGKIKTLKTATLPVAQIAYALTHQVSEARQLSHMKTVDFDNIRVVRLSSVTKGGLLRRFHLRVQNDQNLLAFDPFLMSDAIAQATPVPMPATNGNNSPLQFLHNVLANINVSNALNNLLNNSSISANVSLQNVLNNNKIAIGQVVGIYIGGGGLINTIIK